MCHNKCTLTILDVKNIYSNITAYKTTLTRNFGGMVLKTTAFLFFLKNMLLKKDCHDLSVANTGFLGIFILKKND